MTTTHTHTTDRDERTDEVLEQHDAAHGTRADLVRRHGYDTTQKYLKLYGTRHDRFKGFDGEETTTARQVTIAELPEANGHEVLHALAEYYGYRLEAK